MGARMGMGRIGLIGCLCVTAVYLILTGHSNAGEWQNQSRHSLVIRPVTSPYTPASLTPSRRSEKSKPLSLVIPIQPARQKAILTSSMPPAAESGVANFSNTEAGQGR